MLRVRRCPERLLRHPAIPFPFVLLGSDATVTKAGLCLQRRFISDSRRAAWVEVTWQRICPFLRGVNPNEFPECCSCILMPAAFQGAVWFLKKTTQGDLKVQNVLKGKGRLGDSYGSSMQSVHPCFPIPGYSLPAGQDPDHRRGHLVRAVPEDRAPAPRLTRPPCRRACRQLWDREQNHACHLLKTARGILRRMPALFSTKRYRVSQPFTLRQHK